MLLTMRLMHRVRKSSTAVAGCHSTASAYYPHMTEVRSRRPLAAGSSELSAYVTSASHSSTMLCTKFGAVAVALDFNSAHVTSLASKAHLRGRTLPFGSMRHAFMTSWTPARRCLLPSAILSNRWLLHSCQALIASGTERTATSLDANSEARLASDCPLGISSWCGPPIQ